MTPSPSPPPRVLSGARLRAIALLGAILLILVVLIELVMWRMLSQRVHATRGQEPARSTVAVETLPPEPLLQGSAGHRALLDQDLAEMRQRDDEILNRYVWVNVQAKVVRIPIDRAMDLLVQRGLPVRGAATQPATQAATEAAVSPASAPATQGNH